MLNTILDIFFLKLVLFFLMFCYIQRSASTQFENNNSTIYYFINFSLSRTYQSNMDKGQRKGINRNVYFYHLDFIFKHRNFD